MSIVQSAPLLAPLKVKGGTFYTFSSTLNDFSYLFSDSNVRLVPSKFVALKLPKWSNTTDQRMFRNPVDIGVPSVTDPNTVLPKVIQNYTENMIQYSEASRLDNTLSNYTEAAFWKTLRMLGAMTLEYSGQDVIEDGVTKQLQKELDASADYDPVIKFVGDVNLLNHTKSDANEYVEIFVNIPTNQGLMEDILFKPSSVVHESGLIPVTQGAVNTVGLDDYALTDQVKAIYDNSTTRQYSVGSNLEDANVYMADILNAEATKWRKGDFEFNAVALYYDIFDKNDETTKATNLWGILFIEDFDGLVGNASELPILKKYQPDDIQPGNGYSFRMNLKFSNATNQVTSEITVNDYSTVSMELYMDALRRLTLANDRMESIMGIVTDVKAANDRIVQTMFNAQKILDSVAKIDNHEKRIQLLETGSPGGNAVRITNEELFNAFTKAINGIASTDQTVSITNIISQRSYLGKMSDPEQNIIEFADGTRYKWNALTQNWDSI